MDKMYVKHCLWAGGLQAVQEVAKKEAEFKAIEAGDIRAVMHGEQGGKVRDLLRLRNRVAVQTARKQRVAVEQAVASTAPSNRRRRAIIMH